MADKSREQAPALLRELSGPDDLAELAGADLGDEPFLLEEYLGHRGCGEVAAGRVFENLDFIDRADDRGDLRQRHLVAVREVVELPIRVSFDRPRGSGEHATSLGLVEAPSIVAESPNAGRSGSPQIHWTTAVLL